MDSSTAETWLEVFLHRLQLWYGFTLLVIFMLSVTLNAIITSRHAAQLVRPAVTGPGGRPLPATRRKSQDSATMAFSPTPEISTATKRIYCCTTSFLILTFLANFVSAVSHAFIEMNNPDSKFGWWCGEPASVSQPAVIVHPLCIRNHGLAAMKIFIAMASYTFGGLRFIPRRSTICRVSSCISMF